MALLGWLSERPMHGYEIYQRLAEPTGLGLVWRIKQAQLYALLDRLEAAGDISVSCEAQERAPSRKMLSLTAQGRETYVRWLRSPVHSPREMRLAFLAKLYFAGKESAEVRRTLIAAQRQLCQDWRVWHAAQIVQAGAAFDAQVWQFRMSQVEAILHWLDVCEGLSAEGK